MTPPFPDDLIDDLNARFEHEEPREILRWALVDSDLDRVAVASSFQAEGTCVIDMAVALRPDVPVLFLETGFHFAETLAFKEPILEQYQMEPGAWMVKVNPIATWTRQQALSYLAERNLPHNPLYDLGYAQIGCAPCTRMVLPGEHERDGRWDGSQKVECGIHVHEAARQSLLAGGHGRGRR